MRISFLPADHSKRSSIEGFVFTVGDTIRQAASRGSQRAVISLDGVQDSVCNSVVAELKDAGYDTDQRPNQLTVTW